MGRIRNIAAAAACAGLMLAPAVANAQTPADRNTKVTFSGPVSIPGKTLPAGTYTFRLADSPTDRHIVQVLDKDEMQLLATLLAVPAEKMEAEGDPVITFKETPADRPPAVHYWYYAGERAGNEFVYPKSQALAIAQASGEGVMAVDTDSANVDDWKGTPTRVTATGQSSTASTASSTTPTAQPTTTPEPAPQSAAPATTPQSPTPAPTATPQTSAPTTAPTAPSDTERPTGTSGRAASELPRTASPVPTVGLVGLLAVAGALFVRARRTGLI